jgi:signal transduction histidine kinase
MTAREATGLDRPAPYEVDPTVARAALCRAVLIARAVVTMTAAGTGLFLVNDPWRVVAVVGLVVVATGVEVVALTRNPGVVRAPFRACAVDSVFLVAVLGLSRGTMAYFCFAAGAAALAGVLLGMRALVLWAAQAALGFVVAAGLLRAARPPADLAAFVLAFPMAGVVAGIGTALATAGVVRFVNLSVQALASAQRSAAASERARLARELHDSVTKTLRGISFAALALPSSLRQHPALAEQLASTVSAGAEAAAREARELLEGLRLDAPDQDFPGSVRRICRTWSGSTTIPVSVDVARVDPPVAVRYELTRILHEALRNVAQHARATAVSVELSERGAGIALTVRDNGVGCRLPGDPSALRSAGHFGIVGMSERARAVGGTLRVGSGQGGGTTVSVWIP